MIYAKMVPQMILNLDFTHQSRIITLTNGL